MRRRLSRIWFRPYNLGSSRDDLGALRFNLALQPQANPGQAYPSFLAFRRLLCRQELGRSLSRAHRRSRT